MSKTSLWTTVAAVLVLTTGLMAAQTKVTAKEPAPVGSASEEVLALWDSSGDKVIGMAEDFPEDKYDFKEQKDQRTVCRKSAVHRGGGLYSDVRRSLRVMVTTQRDHAAVQQNDIGALCSPLGSGDSTPEMPRSRVPSASRRGCLSAGPTPCGPGVRPLSVLIRL